jgi:hypothetical protein
MVLSSQDLLLFLQYLVFSGKSQKIDVKNRILLGEFNESVFNGLLVSSLECLNGRFETLHLMLLLMKHVTSVTQGVLKFSFFGAVVSFLLNEVLVKLILNKQVISNFLVEILYLIVFIG